MTTTSQKGFKIGPPMPDIEGGSKIPQALNNPVGADGLGPLHGGAQDHALLGAHFLGTFLIRIAFISERFVNVFRC